MKPADWIHDLAWFASEIAYYLGLLAAVAIIPGLALALWSLSRAGQVQPDYWLLLAAWVSSIFLFLIGIGLKNLVYRWDQKEKGD